MKIKIDCLSRLRGNVMVNHVWLLSTKARIVEKYLVISTNPSIHRVYYSWSADPWHPCHIGTSEGFMKICFIKITFLGAKGNGYLRSKTEYMFCHHFVTCRRKPTSASPRNFSDKKSRGSFFFTICVLSVAPFLSLCLHKLCLLSSGHGLGISMGSSY